MIVPTLCVGMHPVTLRVTPSRADAERPWLHSHAERGNEHSAASCRHGQGVADGFQTGRAHPG
ncbi:hypothetical protein CYL20_15455 [Pseudomonas palleroniana]|nr:hypothetical protein CYL20_15455 [Pseudomonas palleroniana]